MQKVSKKDLKKDYFFVAERSQNHKNPSLELKMCPKPPGRVPRHPKYSKIIKKRAPGLPKSRKIMKTHFYCKMEQVRVGILLKYDFNNSSRSFI